MFLIFDTETTGLPKNYKAPLTDFANWPRLVQLAWQCHDHAGKFLFAKNYVVKPNGFVIPGRIARKLHHITTRKAHEIGRDIDFVLREFATDVQNATLLVGHNIGFDLNIVGCEFLRRGMENVLAKANTLCTQKSSTEFCGIIRDGKPKWPNLTELHRKLFGTPFADAHNAAGDVVATARCFLELARIGVIDAKQLNISNAELEEFKRYHTAAIQPESVDYEPFAKPTFFETIQLWKRI